MSKIKPKTECNGTLLTFVVPADLLAAAKKQIQRIAGPNPVIMMELPLPSGEIELTVAAASLTQSALSELQDLQRDGNLIKTLAKADFDVAVEFGAPPAGRRGNTGNLGR